MVSAAPGADHFFACDTHLSDPGFAVLEQACQLAIAEREQKIKEVEEMRTQWEEIQKRKNKDKDKAKKDSDVEPSKEDLDRPQPPTIKPIYELQRGVFNLRVASKRRAAQERKTRAMLDSPSLFPEAPKHKPV